MAGPPTEVAAVRAAVRACVADLPAGALVLVACSGGPDSLALAAGLAFVAPRRGLRAGGVTVDHGLQPGSAARAERVSGQLRALGLDPVDLRTVTVGPEGGPEGAARAARYAALDRCAERRGAAAVLLGHTRDDQAETVLLGLARGSGARSLAGMAARTGRYRRPLLGLGRRTVHTAAREMDLAVWSDPHNEDPAYTRTRVRHRVLPVLREALGPGIPEALARSAELLRDDADALDAWAESVRERAAAGGDGLDVGALAELPRAVRTRLLRGLAVDAGASPGALTAEHVRALDGLVTRWRGQGAVALPGGLRGHRVRGRVHVE
ncbi:tRNA lysidine(34) synthetase TilS [Spiractinospora alimapuensis]|uniref:tRNA lysidine(34) synthetase TilS n=1 Tax=Spiractinospora alimapuensis TaxID=2820884 RepID=UPI001EEC5576|nr:tRNA lysidine(34) synthetase TilS [Spiractinospora alimapuensis]QVQ50951.1 tRNA lysidine(34) synthetase TilS [Spiractinospora alimapuensis]